VHYCYHLNSERLSIFNDLDDWLFNDPFNDFLNDPVSEFDDWFVSLFVNVSFSDL
jgi:hypothetical protein